jgi:hypothetical protein
MTADDMPYIPLQQSNNQALGDIIGGNKNEITNINQFGAPAPSSYLSKLLERYRHELKHDERTSEKLKELQRYGEAKEEPLIPIETKLIEGHRGDLINFALETKESFAKQLVRHTHFESAQKIHLHLLSRIWSVFQTRILPEIKAGQSRLVVERLIQSEIIDPTLADLQDNPFHYSDPEVHGMIYYLTGNCHIRWI